MVLCFLVHTVCPLASLRPGESRVIYYRVFAPAQSVLSGESCELCPEKKGLLRKEEIVVVARQVQSAVFLSNEVSGRLLTEAVPGEEALVLHDAIVGVLRLRTGDPFDQEMCALWLNIHSLCFTLVCKPHENLLLAEGTLRTLARLCLDHMHLLDQGTKVLLESNWIDVLLSRLLPHGELIFLNHRFAQSLEKDVSGYVSK